MSQWRRHATWVSALPHGRVPAKTLRQACRAKRGDPGPQYRTGVASSLSAQIPSGLNVR